MCAMPFWIFVGLVYAEESFGSDSAVKVADIGI